MSESINHHAKWLMQAAAEVRADGHAGLWNVCDDAAKEIYRLEEQVEAERECAFRNLGSVNRLTAENERLRSQVYQFQARILEKMAQVRAETALRAGAEKRLADIVEILEPFDPPENYAVVVDKIATLANPERYACDPIDTTHTGNDDLCPECKGARGGPGPNMGWVACATCGGES